MPLFDKLFIYRNVLTKSFPEVIEWGYKGSAKHFHRTSTKNHRSYPLDIVSPDTNLDNEEFSFVNISWHLLLNSEDFLF